MFERGCHAFRRTFIEWVLLISVVSFVVSVPGVILLLWRILSATNPAWESAAHREAVVFVWALCSACFWIFSGAVWLLVLSRSESSAVSYQERAIELVERYEAQCPQEKAKILGILKGEETTEGSVVQVFGSWVQGEKEKVAPLWRVAVENMDSGA